MTRAAALTAMIALIGLSACGAPRGPDVEVALVEVTPTESAQASEAPPMDEPDEPTAKGFANKRPPPDEPVKQGPAEPMATDVQQAREIFKQGVAAYAGQDYAAAKRLFQEAYALAPVNAILFNIASAELRMGQTQLACAHFKDYIANGDPGSSRIQEVQQQVQGRCP